jgi:transcriptional regulator with XRE-family HTH domain
VQRVKGLMLANIKTALAVRGIRQTDLAVRLRISTSLLSEVVCGRRQADASLRARIASELSADESWLFSEHVRIPGSGFTGVHP